MNSFSSTSKGNLIQRYVGEKKELYGLVLQIIENPDPNEETDFQNLTNFLDAHQYKNNKKELERFLQLIFIISLNHHRQPNFFSNIEKILTISYQFYQQTFSNEELFTIFQQSKPVLLSLLKTNIITIDATIFKYLTSYPEFKEGKIYYFYPELKSIIKSGKIEGINEIKMDDDIGNFESNRQQFENLFQICSLIRGDLIVDFIQYVNENNISLSSQIKPSIFETNSIFNETPPTLIEYAFFFGSIQIINYLVTNDVELTSSLWLYAIHSNNPEMIAFLEDKKIVMDDRTFSEAIKCHHNSIAHYLYDNYFSNKDGISGLSDDDVFNIYSSFNYEFFSDEIDRNRIFFSLCMNDYNEFVECHMTLKEKEIENDINDIKTNHFLYSSKEIVYAIENNLLDVGYHLLSNLKRIPQKYFENRTNITIIAIPSSVTSIDDFAFNSCLHLKYVSISNPSSLTSIGNNAFQSCKSLIQIKIPSSVSLIGDHAFDGCSSLKQITIPSSVSLIGNYVFNDCSSLKLIKIPNFVTSIGDYAFAGCSSLKLITIPSSVTSIGNYAFAFCSSLKFVVIPLSTKSVGKNLFYSCSSLKQITIPVAIKKRYKYQNFFGISEETKISTFY